MKIVLTPHDIIERALWWKYQYYILDGMSQDKIDKIVEENEEFEITEREALIINLLKCIETDNLKHRLNQHVLHLLSVKSAEVDKDKKKVYAIRKNAIDDELTTFLKNFPEKWDAKANYKYSLEEVKEYIVGLKEKLGTLLIIESEFQGNIIEYVQVTHVKKMLDFNH